MYKFLISLACVLSLNAQMVGGVAIVVKDKAITIYDIEKEMQVSNVDNKTAIDRLIREKLEESEVKERGITVSNSEVYDDIKDTAKRNNMSVNDFYEAALNTNGINSADLKIKIKKKLLSTKLYSAIAYSKMSKPSEAEIKEYYELHKNDYEHPSSFTVVIYQSKDQVKLVEKIQNPMFHSPDVLTNEQVLPYDRITPELARVLEKTPINGFTPVIPNGQGGHMSFYVKDIQSAEAGGLKSVENQIANTISAKKREQVLSDYFARLRANADIDVKR